MKGKGRAIAPKGAPQIEQQKRRMPRKLSKGSAWIGKDAKGEAEEGGGGGNGR